MELKTLTVKTIDAGSLEKCKDIALQALNVKREIEPRGGYIDVKFIENSNRLIVKYIGHIGNLDFVTDGWGEVLDYQHEPLMQFDSTDLKEDVLNDMQAGFDKVGTDDYTLDVSMTIEE